MVRLQTLILELYLGFLGYYAESFPGTRVVGKTDEWVGRGRNNQKDSLSIPSQSTVGD
jgi:hypothetical protein